MVKLNTEIANGKEPEEGKNYKIVKVEQTKTAVQGFNGIRVVMTSSNKKDETQYATMLWNRETASESSKLGSFIRAFCEFFGPSKDGMETDNWTGHEVKIVTWKAKNREIKVIA